MDPVAIMTILSALGSAGALFGGKRPGQMMQQNRFAPNQQAGMNEALQMALQGLKDPTQGFEPIAQQARTSFETQTLPSIAERFTSMGQGAQRSSGFTGALGQAGAGLEENLAAMKSQYGLQNQGLLQQLLGLGLTPQFDTMYQQPRLSSMSSFGSGLAESSIPALLKYLGGM